MNHSLVTCRYIIPRLALTHVFSIPGSTTGVGDTWTPDWLLSELGDYYASWIPEEQTESFQDMAAYSYLYKPGFRIISFPSPLCLS